MKEPGSLLESIPGVVKSLVISVDLPDTLEGDEQVVPVQGADLLEGPADEPHALGDLVEVRLVDEDVFADGADVVQAAGEREFQEGPPAPEGIERILGGPTGVEVVVEVELQAGRGGLRVAQLAVELREFHVQGTYILLHVVKLLLVVTNLR